MQEKKENSRAVNYSVRYTAHRCNVCLSRIMETHGRGVI